MKKKILQFIASLSFIFALCLFSTNLIFASNGISTFGNEDGSGGTGSAYVYSGKKNYSSSSSSSVNFEIRAKDTTCRYMIINISVTNGKISDRVSPYTVDVDSGSGKITQRNFRKNGVRYLAKFKPYSSRANGYDILACAAYKD